MYTPNRKVVRLSLLFNLKKKLSRSDESELSYREKCPKNSRRGLHEVSKMNISEKELNATVFDRRFAYPEVKFHAEVENCIKFALTPTQMVPPGGRDL